MSRLEKYNKILKKKYGYESLKAEQYGGDKEATSTYAGGHIGSYYNYLISKFSFIAIN